MSCFDPHNEKYTLTNLPLSIQTRILGYLCPHQPFRARTNRSTLPYCLPFRDPPVTISLKCGETLTISLPTELISPALASPILAVAAANLLGDRVSYLTHCNTAAQLSTWVKAFAPYIKAVSTRDPLPAWYTHDLKTYEKKTWIKALATQHEKSVQLLKTLSIEAVRLEVLDLMDVPFLDSSDVEDDLMVALCATLENNNATLRELALPVFHTSDICDKALEMSSLKKLNVLSVKLEELHIVDHSKALAPPLLRMIRAVDGHADRSRKLTTLRELWLLNVKSLPYDAVTPSDRHSSVFFSINTLRLSMNAQGDDSSKSEFFILLFKNLKCLFWNKTPRPNDFAFEKMCTKIPEVHFCDPRWITKPIKVGTARHYAEKCEYYRKGPPQKGSGSEAIRTIILGGVSSIDLRNMRMTSQSLENLSVHATRENIRAIRKLVGKCEQMKCLELVVEERKRGPLDAEDWHSISGIVPKSHKNLCQLAIQPLDPYASATTHLETVFSCFEAVTKALGAQARRLAFRALFKTSRGVRFTERVCGMLNACIQHTPALESLELVVGIRDGGARIYDRETEQRIERLLTQLENQLLREVQSLRVLDLGMGPWFSQRPDNDHNTLESHSVCNEIETAS